MRNRSGLFHGSRYSTDNGVLLLRRTFLHIFIDSTHSFEGRSPEPEEISAFLKLPENVEARKQLTSLCVNADPDNWPETEKQLREAFSMKDMEAISWNSEERKQNAENGANALNRMVLWNCETK